MRKYVTEFIGTFIFVFTIGCSIMQTPLPQIAPIAIGASLMVAVYAGGHISGGHYNPAVSLAAFIRGRLRAVDLFAYWVSQLAAAIVAAAAAVFVINPPARATLVLSGHAAVAAFVAEFIFTFMLAFVVLNVATSKDHPNNSFYGLAIGFTVTAGAVAVGGISGGAFNPAVAVGAVVMGLFSVGSLPYYIAACLLGGAVAGGMFKYLNPDDA